jgi:predicted CxxxxCH...CXXCH cytochrome family protein
MRNLKKVITLITIAAAAFALFACGTSTGNNNYSSYSSAVALDSSGKHVANWVTTHKDFAASSVAACTGCHGIDLAGGISKVSCTSSSAVNGFKCHVTSPLDNPTGCASCHGGTATGGPYGTSAPNRKFAHGKHTALAGITCASCHPNAGIGTANHAKATATGDFNRATVNVSNTFTAAAGTFTAFGYNPGNDTCSAISCHGNGGVAATTRALPWSSGAISMASDCTQCHESGAGPVAPSVIPTPQFNSFYSGNFGGQNEHLAHLSVLRFYSSSNLKISKRNIVCTDCHNIGVLTDSQKHFGGLTTNTFAIPAKNTVGGLPTAIDSYASGSCSNVNCHIGKFGDIGKQLSLPWVQ